MPEFEPEMQSQFEPDEESIKRAAALTSNLMRDLHTVVEEGPRPEVVREVFSQQRYDEQAEGTPIADVVQNVSKMATEFAILRRWDSEIVCLRLDDGGLIPVSLFESDSGPTSLFSAWYDYLDREFPFHFGRRIVGGLLRRLKQRDDHLVVTNIREAEQGAHHNLQSFLSYRFAGIRYWNEWIQEFDNLLSRHPSGKAVSSGAGASGGLEVEVSCSTRGLRIHVSPAIFVDWVFFGSPSPTVRNYVLPGRYIFAGDGPMLPNRVPDPAVFRIPPTYKPTLTRF